jgi:hypothetical protein
MVLFAFALSSYADAAPWLPPGDLSLRHDIQLLADARVIREPISTWPLSWPSITRELSRTEPDRLPPSVASAFVRVRLAADRAARPGFSGLGARVSVADHPVEFRSFAETPREEGEVGLVASWLGRSLALNLETSVVSDPQDDKTLRLDGSYVGATLGNVLISAGAMARWWGPGWEGSLIYSNNARPVPSLTIERNFADAFAWRALRWLGPWRATASMGLLEGSGVAVTDARLFAARVNFKPRGWLEVGVSRSAQWCGTGRRCDLQTFGKLLVGRDNPDASLDPQDQPGNQLAGYDARLSSPWPGLRVALYGQVIGEDEAGGLPSRFLGLFGAETWGETRWGSHRLHLEYSDTSCNFSRQEPIFGCAYRSTSYPQGYAYRGRVIGHALGGDGRMVSAQLVLVRGATASWSLLARHAELGRGGVGASGDTKNLELQYNRRFARGELAAGLRLGEADESLQGHSDSRVFVQWRQGY